MPTQTPARVEPRRKRLSGWAADALCCGAVAGVLLAFYWRFLAIGHPQLVYTFSDFTDIFVPLHAFNVQEWRAGRIPLWNSSILAGEPQLAALLPAVFYPFSLVELLVAGHGGPLLGIYLRVWLDSSTLAAGVYLLARRLGVSRVAACAAAVTLSLSGLMTSVATNQLTRIESVAWTPLALVALDRSLKGRHWMIWAWLAGWGFGVGILGGYPQYALLDIPLVAAFAGWRLIDGGSDLARAVRSLILTTVGGATLSAVQLVPAWTFFTQSNRDSLASGGGVGYTRDLLPGFILPGWGGYDKTLFVGILPVALAVTGLIFYRRRSLSWVLAALAFVGILLSMGENTPLYNLVFSHLGFGLFRRQDPSMFVTLLALAILAAFGLHALSTRGSAFGAILGMAVLIGLTVNLFVVNWNNNFPEGYRTLQASAPATMRFLQANQEREPMRIKIDQDVLFPPIQLFDYGLETMDGGIYFQLKRTSDLLHSDQYWRQLQLFNVRFQIADRQLKSDGLEPVPNLDRNVSRMLYPLPRAYVVWNALVAPTPDQALKAVLDPKFDPGTSAIVEQSLDRPLSAAGSHDQKIAVRQPNPQLVLIDTTTQSPGFLVLSYAYYPEWRASIDGQPAPLLRADYAFEGVSLPSGAHQVRLWYDTTSFWRGCAISLASVLVFAGLCLAPTRRNGAQSLSL